MADIKQAIEYAKQNPDSTFAVELKRRIENGYMDNELKQAGLKTSSEVAQPQQDGYIVSTAKKVGTALSDTVKNSSNMFDKGQEQIATTVKDVASGKETPLAGTAEAVSTIGRTTLGATGKIAEGVGGVLNAFVPDWLNKVVENGNKGWEAIANKIKETNPELVGKIQQVASDIDNSQVMKTLVQKTKENPDLLPVLGDAINTVLLGVGFEKGGKVANEVKTGIQEAISGAVDSTKKTITKVGEKAKSVVSKPPLEEGSNASFNQNLTDAYESVFTKLSPTEKASIQLKDVGNGMTGKSVPDFIADPKTKPIIESVANLPEDIKLKPNDTIATKEAKLNQGISRLHQGTEASLAEPTIKAQTSFNGARFNKYMKNNVLDPIEREFGKDSVEYKASEKAVKTAKASIESKDAHGVYTGRQKFSSVWEKDNPRTFKKAKGSFGSQLDPQTSATVEAGRDVYNKLNDFNEELLPENHPLRPRMQEESNLIKAKQEMRARSAGDVGKSQFVRTMEKHPIATKAIKGTANAVGLGGVINLVK